jgi:serine/threonine protein kinase
MQPGTKLGPYEIVEPIGAGGMGEVYRARDTRLNRIVALKVSKEAFSERFEREARVVASLNHPHIATLYDVGPDYLVMEYVEGEPLSGPLPIDKVMQYAAQICEALDAAHKKGITHRDLKPANILVNKQGIKLLDFGLAKIREEPELSEETISKALTAHGAVLGTPQYMAPEQVEGREADARSDIFSLGCVLYEMLTGRKAFAGKNASSIAAAILAKDPEPISNLPPALERVVLTCLAKDPEDRWQSAREVRHALQWSVQLVQAPIAQRNWLPWTVAAVLGAALLVAMALLSLRQPTAVEEKAFQFQIQAPEKTRFNTDSGLPFSVSPDGRMVVFLADSQDRKGSLWIRSLDSATSRPLPGTDDAVGPFWSPDSRFVAFSVNDKKLKRIRWREERRKIFAICPITQAERGIQPEISC